MDGQRDIRFAAATVSICTISEIKDLLLYDLWTSRTMKAWFNLSSFLLGMLLVFLYPCSFFSPDIIPLASMLFLCSLLFPLFFGLLCLLLYSSLVDFLKKSSRRGFAHVALTDSKASVIADFTVSFDSEEGSTHNFFSSGLSGTGGVPMSHWVNDLFWAWGCRWSSTEILSSESCSRKVVSTQNSIGWWAIVLYFENAESLQLCYDVQEELKTMICSLISTY